jgi:phosphoribosyl 1,2-cyclic phosphodiesterase
MSFKVKFWGVRGSIACPSPHHIAFGGNTSCVEVSCGGAKIILDCGTGVRNLGHWLLRKQVRYATMMLSHTHWDHINGFPFFTPAFHPDCEFAIMAGHLNGARIEDIFADQMQNPYFPVPLEAMLARKTFQDFRSGDSFTLPDNPQVRIRTAPLNHPNGATGYRIEYEGKSFCYVTDTEHVPGQPDQNVLGLIEGADLVASTWQEGVRLAQTARVKSLAIFHHDPDHEDRFMERVEAEARAIWPGAFVARENMRINLT